MKPEPTVVRATVRDSQDAQGDAILDIECRFSDGQKLAAVQVDCSFPLLAEYIAEVLTVNRFK